MRSKEEIRPQALEQDRATAFSTVNVSRETLERLEQFVELFLPWQGRTNLIAASTVPVLWSRHIADSLQVLKLAPDARLWVDLGSGGGFPGLVIACALADQPGAHIHLVESTGKKASFLREAARELQLPATIHQQRIEQFTTTFTGRPDVVTARALAPMPELLAYAAPLLQRGAQGLFLKGQDVGAELTAASKSWSIETTLVPSLTDPRGSIVVVKSAARR